MESTEIKRRLLDVLSSNYIYIDANENENVDLSLYIEDSIHFISFIVSLEEEFNIEFPDELINFEKLQYLNNICIIIEELLNK